MSQMSVAVFDAWRDIISLYNMSLLHADVSAVTGTAELAEDAGARAGHIFMELSERHYYGVALLFSPGHPVVF